MSKASSGSGLALVSSAAAKTITVLSALKMRWERNRGARQLHKLDDFMLKDIGLARSDIRFAVDGKIRRRG